MRTSSIFNRLTALSLLIGLLATALLFGAATYVVRAHSAATLAHLVDTDIAGLVDIYASGGKPELEKRLVDRIAVAPQSSDAAHYLLADDGSARLAGDIARWPDLNAKKSEQGFITLADGQHVFARSTQLGPNLRLVVAREYGERDALLSQIALAFLAAGVAVMGLIVTAGIWAARRLRGRVQVLNKTFRLRESGDVAPRLSHAHAHDELDELSMHVDDIIARQSALVASLRNTSDQTAHELRTPLMHLDTRLQRIITLSADKDLTATLLAARQDIKAAIRMLESLLDIAANEAQRGDMSRLVEVNLSELAISMADLFAESAHDLGLALETAIAPDVMMRCDPIQMTRMLSNLLDNALKYVPSGGTIRLSVAAGPKVSVIDNGSGVPLEMREPIFQRFQRAGDERQGGHGLGLALVRAIAARHGLSVRCEDAFPGAAFLISPEGT